MNYSVQSKSQHKKLDLQNKQKPETMQVFPKQISNQ